MGLIVNMRLRPSNRNFRLSGDRCRSLILGFDNHGELLQLGAEITTPGHLVLAPGTEHCGAHVKFWADHPPNIHESGTPFSIWYGEDVGTGIVTGSEPDE